MPNDAVRHIRLFEIGNLFLSQFHGQRAHRFLQM